MEPPVGAARYESGAVRRRNRPKIRAFRRHVAEDLNGLRVGKAQELHGGLDAFPSGGVVVRSEGIRGIFRAENAPRSHFINIAPGPVGFHIF
ncbi:hypothetical protein SDC9_81269 [bioreactor metagenome]|uniref:Uncharacterized protein n=1 Tax=bioreactor metagenome TaxID=1076179 RepID=A0A644Z1T6_9ZZZZ